MSFPPGSLFYQRPALSALCILILGILLSSFFSINYYLPLIFLLTSLTTALYFYLRQRNKGATIALSASLFFLGWYLATVASGPFPPNHVANIVSDGRRAEIIGRVIEEPDTRPDKIYLTIEADSIRINDIWIPAMGRIRARLKFIDVEIDHADYLHLSGYLYKPLGASNPSGFDYAAYLKTKQIFGEITVSDIQGLEFIDRGKSFLSSAITPLRAHAIAKANEYLQADRAAILTGFLLGEKRALPEKYVRLFKNTGTAHLMAVSGSNVGIVLAVFACPLVLLRLPRGVKASFLLVVIILFSLLTRLEPSVVRASIMAAIGLIAYGWMKKPDPVNLLAFAGLVMLLWRPVNLFDVGLQLSFAATFGIIYGFPGISKLLVRVDRPGTKWLHYATLILGATLTAQVAVMPLMARYFQYIPILGSLANLPVILLASVITAIGILFLAFSPFGHAAATLIAMPLGFAIDSVIAILRFFASLPGAAKVASQPSWTVILIFWLSLYLLGEIIFKRRISRVSLIALLFLANVEIWLGVTGRKADWSLEFLDVRRNHAWVFSAPGGPVVAAFDSFVPDGDTEEIFIRHIINRQDGKIDYLLTVTPEAPEVERISNELHPRIINFQSPDGRAISCERLISSLVEAYKKDAQSSSVANVLLHGADNTNAGFFPYPAVEIDVDGGAIIMAGWAGMGKDYDKQGKRGALILEMPWSRYARSSCLETISVYGPQFSVFSPDRFSVSAPNDRRQLTHSRDSALATSWCGAFSIKGYDGRIVVESMRPIR